ncbi:MAG: sulfatase-like hydrolase/transferase, partial [Planctomycetota bacterium]
GGKGKVATKRPKVILVMSDDQGWGQTGYYDHPILKTPNIDAMAANGLRLDRFYAGAPVCSPTRATVLTGRTNNRTGVFSHGYGLRLQERTIAQALKKGGYVTGHFGKWHLNGYRGVGVPILACDTHHPGRFGFDEWLSVTNFFDIDPLMGRKGKFEQFKGDSSEVIIDEALKFIEQNNKAGDKPFFAVVWYGSPHSPFFANEEDKKAFSGLDEKSAQHYGELAAMDRSIGTLRAGLKKLGVADDTLIWFNSDNGGLSKIKPETVGGLRGFKGSVWEGGLRVPCIIEWPGHIKPRVTNYPASTMDIAPTLVELLSLPTDSLLELVDGESIAPLFKGQLGKRKTQIPFRLDKKAALIDNDYKIVIEKLGSGKYELYDLDKDPTESKNIYNEKPQIAARLTKALDDFNASLDKSNTGADYPTGSLSSPDKGRTDWETAPEYQRYLKELDAYLRPAFKKKKKKK